MKKSLFTPTFFEGDVAYLGQQNQSGLNLLIISDYACSHLIYQSTNSAHFNKRNFKIIYRSLRKIISSGGSRIILNNIPKTHRLISPLMASWDPVSHEAPNPIQVCLLIDRMLIFFISVSRDTNYGVLEVNVYVARCTQKPEFENTWEEIRFVWNIVFSVKFLIAIFCIAIWQLFY